MNFNDSEIVLGILKEKGYTRSAELATADVILLMTCAIREAAESKIWERLRSFKRMPSEKKPVVGLLGCMAERLKDRLLSSEKLCEIVCGPDAYRELPRLLDLVLEQDGETVAMNVMLSAEETYADIAPVRLHAASKSAFVSIMRGCNNMCSFCIVPFVRGVERSRPVDSLIAEIEQLQAANDIKEIILLGQNVNSYRGTTNDAAILAQLNPGFGAMLTRGFASIFKRRPLQANELSFTSLLTLLAKRFPNVRFRFTSPHPKDFPLDLLEAIRDNANIAKAIHLPVQSGSTEVLQRMRRGYSRESYLALVATINAVIPGVTLSTDLIAGFCGESEQEHQQSISLLQQVRFDMAYMFAYSMRPKTHAHRHYQDSVPEALKQARLREIIDTFHGLQPQTGQGFIGSLQLVLVEGASKRSTSMLMGKSDGNRPVLFTPPPAFPGACLVGSFVSVRIDSCHGGSLFGSFQQVEASIADFVMRQSSINKRLPDKLKIAS